MKKTVKINILVMQIMKNRMISQISNKYSYK